MSLLLAVIVFFLVRIFIKIFRFICFKGKEGKKGRGTESLLGGFLCYCGKVRSFYGRIFSSCIRKWV